MVYESTNRISEMRFSAAVPESVLESYFVSADLLGAFVCLEWNMWKCVL